MSAIVVNWNTRGLLMDCLRNLAANAVDGRELEIIVVDNGSTDGSAEMVRADWPGVQLIANVENVGFTRANNQAIRASHGDYLLLINTDARLQPGCLSAMLARMEGDARVGAVGPRLVYGDGRWQRWTAGRAPTLWTALTYFLFLERLFPGWPAFRSMYLGQDLRRAFAADWVCSACMLLRRAALDQVGLLDERLFVYMDDVELCQRLRAGGWSVWYCPEGEAVHFGSQSTPGSIAAGSSRALRAFNAYFARHHGPAATLALRGVEAVGFGLRVLAYGIAARASSPAASARLSASARAHWVHLKATKEMNA